MEILHLYDSDFEDLYYFSKHDSKRNERHYQRRPDYLNDLSDMQFFDRFRMSKESFLEFLDEIEEQLNIKGWLVFKIKISHFDVLIIYLVTVQKRPLQHPNI
jgi:hypothetical protein